MRTARMLGLCQVTLFSLFCLGCQRGPAPLMPVTGKVTYKGYALQSGAIVFTPDANAGASGPIAHGKINSDGSFHLFAGEAPGAPAGKYRVSVTSYGSALVSNVPFNAPSSVLPDKYSDPQLSGLVCEVQPNRANSFDIKLD